MTAWGRVSEAQKGRTDGTRSDRTLTLAVNRHVEVLYTAIGAKNFAEMVFIDVLCEFLDDNLAVV